MDIAYWLDIGKTLDICAAAKDIGYLCQKNKEARPLINLYHPAASFFLDGFPR